MHVIALYQINGLAQERRNSSALAMDLRLLCTTPSTYLIYDFQMHM